MQVEKRKLQRRLMRLTVRLFQGDRLVITSKTHDVNAGGMFIDTDVLLFQKNSQLDIVIDSLRGDSRIQYRYPATVVHRCWKGIGVKLAGDPLASKQLSETLYAAG